MSRKADPAKVRRHLSRRAIGTSGAEYRVTYGGNETDFVVVHNGNESSHSPLQWCLVWSPPEIPLRDHRQPRPMDYEAGTIRAILDRLALHFANVATIEFA
jgi:hypothetical protein